MTLLRTVNSLLNLIKNSLIKSFRKELVRGSYYILLGAALLLVALFSLQKISNLLHILFSELQYGLFYEFVIYFLLFIFTISEFIDFYKANLKTKKTTMVELDTKNDERILVTQFAKGILYGFIKKQQEIKKIKENTIEFF